MSIPPDPPEIGTPFGYTILCEDIRTEIDGKHSLIGVLSGSVVLQDYPAVIPKIGMSITYMQPADFPLGSLKIRVLFEPKGGDDQTLATLFEADIDLVEGASRLSPRTDSLLAANAQLVISPFKLAEPGAVKVRAYPEAGPPVRLGSFNFEKVGGQESEQSHGPVPSETATAAKD